jgi:hypothetical protein
MTDPAREMQRIFAEGDHYIAQLAEAERLVLEAAEKWRDKLTDDGEECWNLIQAIDNWREVRGGACYSTSGAENFGERRGTSKNGKIAGEDIPLPHP